MIREIELENAKYLNIELDGDWIKISYKEYVLFEDLAREGLSTLIRMLKKANKGHLLLRDELKEKGVGYWWNEYTEMDNDDEDIASFYWLWSTRCIQTWLYTDGDDVELEISPSYPWHFLEPEENEQFIGYSEFIDSFEVYEKLRLKKSEINRVVSELEVIIDKI